MLVHQNIYERAVKKMMHVCYLEFSYRHRFAGRCDTMDVVFVLVAPNKFRVFFCKWLTRCFRRFNSRFFCCVRAGCRTTGSQDQPKNQNKSKNYSTIPHTPPLLVAATGNFKIVFVASYN